MKHSDKSMPAGSDQADTGAKAEIVRSHSETSGKPGETMFHGVEQRFSDLGQAVNTHSIVAITDKNGTITYVNDLFCQISGYTREELIGRHHRIVNADAPQQKHFRTMWRTLARGRIWKGEISCCSKYGKNYWVNSTVIPFLDVAGVPYQYIALRTDITGHKKTEQALQHSNERLASIFNAVTNGLVAQNTEGKVVGANAIATAQLGATLNTTLSWSGIDENPFLTALTTNQPVRDCIVSLIKPDLEVGWFSVNAEPVCDKDGKVYMVVSSYTDISAYKRFETDMQEIAESLEERVRLRTLNQAEAMRLAENASMAKDRFLATMSHEIRTPLNGIIGMAYLALKSQHDPKQRSYLEKIHTAGEYLLGIVDDILIFSKVEAGKLQLENIGFDLDVMLKNFSDLLGNRAAEKGLDLRIELDPTLCHKLCGDSLRLTQILINFAGNAIKFTERGSITLRVLKCAESNDACVVRFEVQDTGFGITEEEKDQLFQPFQQADTTIARRYGGTGLGLAICKQLAELMHGEVGVESTLGHGSTFWLSVSLRKSLAQTPDGSTIPAPDTEADHSFGGMHILVAEDNEFNQQIAIELLESVGAKVTIAADGKQALDLLRHAHFDSVLMDLQMPVMGGMEALRQIRADSTLASLPVIAMTANAYDGDRDKCIAAGMDDFVSKPVKPALLYAALAKHLRREMRQVLPVPVAMPSPASGVPTVDLMILANMVNHHPEKIRKFAYKFLDSAKKDLVYIEAALVNQDISALNALGHRIKSAAHTVGATGFADLCLALEKIGNTLDLAEARKIVACMRPLLTKIGDEIEHQLQTFPAGSETAAVTAHSRRRSEMRVLLIDDEPFQMEFIRAMLHSLGVSDIVAEIDGIRALAIARNAPFDVLLCDLSMPGMDGIEFLRLIAQQKFGGGVALVSGMNADVLKAAEKLIKTHGLNYFGTLKKPVSASGLALILARAGQVEPRFKSGASPVSLSLDDLRSGLASDCIEMYYQPKISTATLRLTGVECLARWHHPEHGMITPARFIPALEQSGMIDAFTLTVLRKSAAQLGQWTALGQDFRIAINISMINLRQLDLPEIFEDIVRGAGAQPANIIFEMVEIRTMENFAVCLEVLTRLRLKGFGLSVDDFGAGIASMNHLKQLPFSELKIDRTFFNETSHDESIREMLKSTFAPDRLGHLNLVAKDVETQADWDSGCKAGCNEAQGFFIAKPMPALELIFWKKKWEASIPAPD